MQNLIRMTMYNSSIRYSPTNTPMLDPNILHIVGHLLYRELSSQCRIHLRDHRLLHVRIHLQEQLHHVSVHAERHLLRRERRPAASPARMAQSPHRRDRLYETPFPSPQHPSRPPAPAALQTRSPPPRPPVPRDHSPCKTPNETPHRLPHLPPPLPSPRGTATPPPRGSPGRPDAATPGGARRRCGLLRSISLSSASARMHRFP